jgi:hypothetical protein
LGRGISLRSPHATAPHSSGLRGAGLNNKHACYGYQYINKFQNPAPNTLCHIPLYIQLLY